MPAVNHCSETKRRRLVVTLRELVEAANCITDDAAEVTEDGPRAAGRGRRMEPLPGTPDRVLRGRHDAQIDRRP